MPGAVKRRASTSHPESTTMKRFFSIIAFFFVTASVVAQPYQIVIKGGHVIDPKNNINELMDVAIHEGKIARVAKTIDATGARQVVDAKGMYITPGLIDIHGHVFFGTQPDHYLSDGLTAIMPDGFTFRVGVTTIVDAGEPVGSRSLLLKKTSSTTLKQGCSLFSTSLVKA
jgi:dihydroorotase